MAVRDIPPNLMLIIRSFTNAPWWETNCLGSLQLLKLYSMFSMMATRVHFNGNEKFIVFLIWPFPIASRPEIDESTGISEGKGVAINQPWQQLIGVRSASSGNYRPKQASRSLHVLHISPSRPILTPLSTHWLKAHLFPPFHWIEFN